MIASFFYMIVKVILVVVILSAMVMILLGIGQLFRHDPSDASLKLRKELQENDDVISQNSVFHQFLIRKRNSGKKAVGFASRKNNQ